MRNGTDGYPEGIEYTYGYQAELNPLSVHLALLNVGIASPSTSTACELGFGHGVSMNMHAAASTTQWYGTDFNPAHVEFARGLASSSGAAAYFFDQSFAEFCSRRDLPDFDFIGMHGVWSWISDQNRGIVVDFINRKLKTGGVLYIGYNTLSGHAGFLPMQELLTRHVESRQASGLGMAGSIDSALKFADKVLAASPDYATENPHIAARLATIKSQDPAYVAHEYINRTWTPMSFSRLAEMLAAAKLTYACSARFFDMVDVWNLTPDQQALLNDIPDINTRETARDFMMDRWFRKEYWVKGPRRLTMQEKMAGLRRQRVVLGMPRNEVDVAAETNFGRFEAAKAVCDPILDALAGYAPQSLEQIEQTVRERGIGFADIVHIVLTLVETRALFPVQDAAEAGLVQTQTSKLNALLCARARHGAVTNVLASPVIGGGRADISRLAQLFSLGVGEGKTRPGELAAFAMKILRSEGVVILDEEQPLVPPDGNPDALTVAADAFVRKLAPALRALKIL